MNNTLKYNPEDSASVKSAFETLAVRLNMDFDAVVVQLQNNSFAVTNKQAWSDECTNKYEVLMLWAAGEVVNRGTIRAYNGNKYTCIQAHTTQVTWEPPNVPALWLAVPPIIDGYPKWVQPLGAQDAYPLNAKVHHLGSNYVSIAANNVWAPGVYGWNVI